MKATSAAMAKPVVVGQMIYIATERAAEWFWKGAR
jgi:hypothetical protein